MAVGTEFVFLQEGTGRPVIDSTLAQTSEDGFQIIQFILLQKDRLQLTAVFCNRRGVYMQHLK